MSKFPPGLLVCLLLLPLTLGCERSARRSEGPGSGSLDFTSQVGEAPARRGPDFLKINGVFVPTRRIKIKSEFSGRVENLTVAKGTLVARQNPLFRIEDDQLFDQLAFLRSQLQSAEMQLERIGALANFEGPVEEIQEESMVEVEAEAPIEEVVAYREPTFTRLASEVEFTSADAGGIWPAVDPRVIARSHDAPDAGGIWPSYGVREMVNGEGPLSDWSAYFAAASVPMPASSTEFTRVQYEILTQPRRVELPSEAAVPAMPVASDAESRLALYQAQVDLMRATIAAMENELVRREVSSPLDGRIQEVVVSEGSEVQAGDFLVEIYQVNPIEFSFQIPKDQVDFLELGMKVKGQLSDPPILAFEGEISYIGAELNADNETVEVRARIDNADDALKVGSKGSAEIDLGSSVAAQAP
ncbi:MAG TPA: efflux RND transporter periplasmic adaptor subunit [bacterium]|nr:efflux RND transporter periplasmic adaptor subunit [bacterium]